MNIILFALFTAKEQILSLIPIGDALPAREIDPTLGILDHIIIDMPALSSGHTLLF